MEGFLICHRISSFGDKLRTPKFTEYLINIQFITPDKTTLDNKIKDNIL